jgi:hypothetical protein
MFIGAPSLAPASAFTPAPSIFMSLIGAGVGDGDAAGLALMSMPGMSFFCDEGLGVLGVGAVVGLVCGEVWARPRAPPSNKTRAIKTNERRGVRMKMSPQRSANE